MPGNNFSSSPAIKEKTPEKAYADKLWKTLLSRADTNKDGVPSFDEVGVFRSKLLEAQKEESLFKLSEKLLKRNATFQSPITKEDCAQISAEVVRTPEHLEATLAKFKEDLNELSKKDDGPFRINPDKIEEALQAMKDKIKEVDVNGNNEITVGELMMNGGTLHMDLDMTPFLIPRSSSQNSNLR